MELKATASKKNVSLSSYVNGVLKEHLDDSWPEGYFDLIGSLKEDDDPLKLPEDLPDSMDAPRKTL